MTETEAPTSATNIAEPAKNSMLRGSVFTVVGYGSSQLIRLASNIVLARILFPEAFGLMALVNVFLQGLQLFSDMGLSVSVIQHPRGSETGFLRTVWTLGILRGLVLVVGGVVLAWPVAAAYDNAELTTLIQVSTLALAISAFRSTSIQLATRKLVLGRVVLIEVVSQLAASAGMILLAWQFESVWALVSGGLIAAVVHMTLSHLVLGGPRMSLRFDRAVARDVLHFGKWIFLSTALTFGVNCLDRIALGKLMTMSELGVYSIAAALVFMIVQLGTKLSSTVLIPVYSRLLEADNLEEKRARLFRIRSLFCVTMLVPVFALMFLGQFVVDLLYDDRYSEAGWMLSSLVIGAGFGIIPQTLSPIMLASGNSRRHLVFMTLKFVVLATLMLVLGYHFGVRGVIWASIFTPLLSYPVLVYLLRNEKLAHPKLEIPLLILVGAVGALAVT